MKITSKHILTAAVATMGFTALANADVVNMKYTGSGKGQTIKVTFDGDTNNVFAGQMNFEVTSGTGIGAAWVGNHITFCTDLYQSTSSSVKTYTITSLEYVPGADPMGASAAQLISNMYQVYGALAMATTASNNLATAFQVAIWEIATDWNGNASSLNITTGGFKAKTSGGSTITGDLATQIGNMFAAALGTVATETYGLYGLKSSSYQDQIITTVVPTPGVGALAGLGLMCLSRRRRRGN